MVLMVVVVMAVVTSKNGGDDDDDSGILWSMMTNCLCPYLTPTCLSAFLQIDHCRRMVAFNEEETPGTVYLNTAVVPRIRLVPEASAIPPPARREGSDDREAPRKPRVMRHFCLVELRGGAVLSARDVWVEVLDSQTGACRQVSERDLFRLLEASGDEGKEPGGKATPSGEQTPAAAADAGHDVAHPKQARVYDGMEGVYKLLQFEGAERLDAAVMP